MHACVLKCVFRVWWLSACVNKCAFSCFLKDVMVSAVWVEVGDSHFVRFWRVTLCLVVKDQGVAHLVAYTSSDLKASV